MNETFASVLLFHTALKTYFTETLGWTVDRTVAPQDIILTNGAGVFLRLRRKANDATVAVGLELGTNADTLELSNSDPERVLPFDTSVGGVFQCSAQYWEAASRIEIAVMASGAYWSRRYNVDLNLNSATLTVTHRDHLRHEFEPNFKDRGGPYVQAGV